MYESGGINRVLIHAPQPNHEASMFDDDMVRSEAEP